MNRSIPISRALMALAGACLMAGLTACQKMEKTSTAGGGASTQSVMRVRGAAR